MPQQENDRQVINATDASSISGLSRSYIQYLAQTGRVEATKPWGREWMIYKDSLLSFLAHSRSPGRKGRRGPRRKSIIGKNGHVHLSTALASERYGYAQNYLLELRRAELIVGELRGRDWYIDEESLVAYKKSKHPDFIVESTLAEPPALPAPTEPESGQPASPSVEPQAPAPSAASEPGPSSDSAPSATPEPDPSPSDSASSESEPPTESAAVRLLDGEPAEPDNTPADTTEITPPSTASANQSDESSV